MKYQQEPDYEFIRKLFKDGLKKRGGTDDGKNIKFTVGKMSSPSSSAAATELCNGHSSPEKETRDKAARQRPAAKVSEKLESKSNKNVKRRDYLHVISNEKKKKKLWKLS